MKESEKMRFKQAIYGSRRVKETLIFLTEMPEGGIQVTSHSAPLIPSHESPATHLKSDGYQSFCLLVFLTSHSFCAASTSSFL